MKMTTKEFKDYYERYYANSAFDIDEIKSEIENWKYYRNKILDGTLTGYDYNSIKENFENNENYYSLAHFLERQSNGVGNFGSMVSGKLVLWIEGVKPNEIWHNTKKTSDGKFGNVVLESEEKRTEFFKKLLEYLKKLIQQYTFDDLIKYLNDEDNLTQHFGSPSFIEKIVIFNAWTETLTDEERENNKTYDYNNKLVFIYKINKIAEIKLIDEEHGKKDLFYEIRKKSYDTPAQNLEMNKSIVEKILEILKVENPTIDTLARIQKCLWELTNDKDRELITSEEKKNIIFYGAPGTSKTYNVKKALEGNKDVEYKFVQFHPGFTYEDFIEGIKPVGIDSSGNLKFDVVNGCFKDYCIQARDNPDKKYYFIVDEINRANLSSVFGETLSLLENDYRWDINEEDKNLLATPLSKVIQKLYEDAEKSNDKDKKESIEKLIFHRNKRNGEVLFGIPKNIHFIGMMNDVDKSIDSFDLALRRRFVWVRKDFDENVIRNFLNEKDVSKENRDNYIKSCVNLNYFITGCNYKNNDIVKITPLNLGRAFEIGHAIFMRISDVYFSRKGIINEGKVALWNENLEPTLIEYLRTSLTEADLNTAIENARTIFLGKH